MLLSRGFKFVPSLRSAWTGSLKISQESIVCLLRDCKNMCACECVLVHMCACAWVCVCTNKKIKNKVWEWHCPPLSRALTTYTIATSLRLLSKRVAYKNNRSVLRFRSSGENPIRWSPTTGFSPINLPTCGSLCIGLDHSPTRSQDVLLLSWCCYSSGPPLSFMGFFSVTMCFEICLLLATTCIYCIFSTIMV